MRIAVTANPHKPLAIRLAAEALERLRPHAEVEPSADTTGDGVLDEPHAACARLLEGALECSPLHASGRSGNTAEHLGSLDSEMPGPFEEFCGDLIGQLEIHELALPYRPHDGHLASCSTCHGARFGAECEQLPGGDVDSGECGLVHEQAFRRFKDAGASRADIDGEGPAHDRSTSSSG